LIKIDSRDRCYDFLNIFAKKSAKKLASLTQNKAKLCENLIITLVFEKNANFFAENCQKSQKIVIITSTPGPAAPPRDPDVLGPRPRHVALPVAGSRRRRRQVRSVHNHSGEKRGCQILLGKNIPTREKPNYTNYTKGPI
jgi:hypothetical protein